MTLANEKTWGDAEPIYFYKWKKVRRNGLTIISDWITDISAARNNFKKNGWIKIEGTIKISVLQGLK